jgi:hypothetical protein
VPQHPNRGKSFWFFFQKERFLLKCLVWVEFRAAGGHHRQAVESGRVTQKSGSRIPAPP